MYKNISLILFVILISSVVFCQAGDSEAISGKIITGYRVLDVDPDAKDNSFTVYRGDYIKFSYPEKFATLDFQMPELKYTGVLFPEPEKSPFFKMKAVGTYQFSLGEAGGSITVIDLVRPNYTEVTADEAAEILKNLHPFILDVRTPGEYQQIYIEGSYLIPIQQLQARIGELESKKHEDVFVYCATGNRSTVASRILADLGFKRIYNLRYGVYDWARNGHPSKTGK
ncbi:MAG TPA: rhodanese-like domain-containing protein [Desulfobacterales bacterium]|nr:rhodanese-like domain-containing protein [Desulfobacterales bacterium]